MSGLNLNDKNWRLPHWFPEMDSPTMERLHRYYEELLRFNKKINLVSKKNIDQADQIHFADSVLASRLIIERSNANEFHDLGSGNGFPGLVMAILYPDRKITVVDRDQRKVEFIKHISWTLGLKNVEHLVSDVENLEENSIENAISRGFAPFSRCLPWALKFIKENGSYYHLKSSDWKSEIDEVDINILNHWIISISSQYRWPESEIGLVVIKTTRRVD